MIFHFFEMGLYMIHRFTVLAPVRNWTETSAELHLDWFQRFSSYQWNLLVSPHQRPACLWVTATWSSSSGTVENSVVQDKTSTFNASLVDLCLPCLSGCVSAGWHDRRVKYDGRRLETTEGEKEHSTTEPQTTSNEHGSDLQVTLITPSSLPSMCTFLTPTWGRDVSHSETSTQILWQRTDSFKKVQRSEELTKRSSSNCQSMWTDEFSISTLSTSIIYLSIYLSVTLLLYTNILQH